MANNNTLGAAKRTKNDKFCIHNTSVQKDINTLLEHEPNISRIKNAILHCDASEWSNSFIVCFRTSISLAKIGLLRSSCEKQEMQV